MKEGTRTPIAIWSEFCAVAPSPELKERMKAELHHARGAVAPETASLLGLAKKPNMIGLDDGVIIPPEQFPPGTSRSRIRSASADRAPLRGTVRVIVVLVDFSDRTMGQTTTRFNDLFFSTGVLPHGSVKEYYKEVTGNLIDIIGEVRGPYRMPQTLAWYANNNFGIGNPSGEPRANIMARDAAAAADADVNYAPYDNDGNGYVDAFVVIHAGSGGEATGNSGDIWSHKWTLPSVYTADGTKIYAYLTIPEDCRLGVCAHELGHLLFGFPDLYDTDYSSEGVGNWCLMAGGSWNGTSAGAQAGDIPAHPSAWCKVNQGWATVTNVTSSGMLTISDVKTSRSVNRLWKDGAGGNEYFLVENRQRSGYDAGLPGDGLLVWHIDESQSGNEDENHYKVGLVQADGKRDMELDHNRGDGGDPYPGSSNNTSLTDSSTPNSKSYAGVNTCVSISNITASAATMTASIAVSCGKSSLKDKLDHKTFSKDRKDLHKELRKDLLDHKTFSKDRKDIKDSKESAIPYSHGHSPETAYEEFSSALYDLESRIAAIEERLGSGSVAQAFIGPELRPDLEGGPVYEKNTASIEQRMTQGDRDAKRQFDTIPPR